MVCQTARPHWYAARMSKRIFRYDKCVITLALIAVALVGCQSNQPLQRYTYTHQQMGTQFRLVFYAQSEKLANHVSQEVFDRIDQLNAILSDYDANSELNALSATSGSGKAVSVSIELWNVLVRSQKMSIASDGAFDVTVGPIVKLWRRARRIRVMPKADRLTEALKAVGYQAMRFDE